MLKIKKVRPMFTSIVTTGDRFEKDQMENGVIVARKGDLKLWQTVKAVGGSVRDILPGDKVMVNVENYRVRKYDKNSIHNDLDDNPTVSYRLNWLTIYDKKGRPEECLLLQDRDILYAFDGEETDAPAIQVPDKKIVV